MGKNKGLSISGYVSKFLDGIQQGTQKRFIKKAQKRGIPKDVLAKMSDLDKDVIELREILKDL